MTAREANGHQNETQRLAREEEKPVVTMAARIFGEWDSWRATTSGDATDRVTGPAGGTSSADDRVPWEPAGQGLAV